MTVFAATGEQLDHFWAYGAVPSPNGRLVALRRWVQARGATVMDSQYRVYDLERTPKDNRRGQDPHDEIDDVGSIFYPVSPGEAAREPDMAHVGNVHNALTDLTWSPDSRQLAVLDRQGGTATPVLGELRDDGRLTVRAAPLCELGRLGTGADAGRDCRRLDYNRAVLSV